MPQPPPPSESADPFAFAREDPRGTTRLEGFSDSVFATAATLLIFSVALPEVGSLSGAALVSALLGQWPVYVGLVLSYLLIGSTWAYHHRMFRYIARTDHALLVINNLMLLTVVVIPFVTTLLASVIQNPEQAQIGAVLYGGVWTIGGILFNGIWWYAVRAHLLDPAMPPRAVHIMTWRTMQGPILYGIGFLVSFFNAPLALIIFVIPGVLFLLPQRFTFRRFRSGDASQK